ncbi:ankyrin repeat domain-containing protein [Fretibacterium fastidiosum]|uniref:ankyrin repeat domain-containing protein n=1 Tax=Fretibacterium fastidiosum TaxID=651822 RepID=UPI0038FD0D3E
MKKSTLHTRSVSGFVFLFLLPLTLFAGQASATDTKTEDLLAIADGARPERVRQLIQAGADVNAKNEYGWTPLMIAAIENTPEVLKVLIEAGADVNAKDRNGLTPLMHAAGHNTNPEVLKVLLEAGADAKAKNNEGKTALDCARWNGKLKGTGALKLLEEKTGQN